MSYNKKISQQPQPKSIPYSDENGSLVNWLSNDNVTLEGNTFNGEEQLVKTDAAGKIPADVIPTVAITEVFVVNSQTEMLALDAEKGDIAIRADIQSTFILSNEPASTLSNWIEIYLNIPVYTGATSSANGTKGLVKQPLAGDQGKYLKGDGTWYDIGTVLHTDMANLASVNPNALAILKNGLASIDLDNISANGTPKLIPTGGATGQFLRKNSNANYDVSWQNIPQQYPTITWHDNISGTTLSASEINGANLVKIYKNGILLRITIDYTISGTTITFVEPLVTSDMIATEVF